MKKIFLGTFDELQAHLQHKLDEGFIIEDIEYVSYITAVNSFLEDNMIRCFILKYKDVSKNMKD